MKYIGTRVLFVNTLQIHVVTVAHNNYFSPTPSRHLTAQS